MPGVFEILARGKSTRMVGSCDNYYVLAPGDLLKLEAWPAWCEACRRFTEAERFDSLESYDQQIKTAEYYANRPGHIPPDQYLLQLHVKHLPDLRRRREWRRGRRSPPRCIECGSTAVRTLWGDTNEFDVLGFGRVELRVVGSCSSEGSRRHFRYFTPEGDRIGEPRAGNT